MCLVGCGTWGALILRELGELGRAVAVVDLDPARRADLSAQGHTVHAQVSEVDSPISAFIIATPASTHFSVAAQLIDQHPAPVFVEKPLTVNSKEAIELRDKGDGRIFVMHTWRHHPAVLQLRSIVEAGTIGVLRTVTTERSNWTSPRTDVDVLWTFLPHDFSIALELTGDVPQVVAAHAESNEGFVVAATVLARQVDGSSLVSSVSARRHTKTRTIHLSGSRGTAWFGGDDTSNIALSTGWSDDPATELVPIHGGSALTNELRAICRFVDSGGPPPCTTVADAARIVTAIDDVRAMSR